MGRTTIDWRWIVAIIIVLIFFGQLNLGASPALSIIILALGGYWAVQAGLTPWRGRGSLFGSSTKVTYWRCQRIELPQSRRPRFRTPAGLPLLASLIYLLMGAGLWLGAVRLLLRLVAR